MNINFASFLFPILFFSFASYRCFAPLARHFFFHSSFICKHIYVYVYIIEARLFIRHRLCAITGTSILKNLDLDSRFRLVDNQ